MGPDPGATCRITGSCICSGCVHSLVQSLTLFNITAPRVLYADRGVRMLFVVLRSAQVRVARVLSIK